MPPLRSLLLLNVLACSLGCASAYSSSKADPPISIQVSEGTELSFDLSPDGRSIVFDLLGQLWLLPAEGGEARAITDAVRDVAEDSDPSFSPDGQRVVFRAERNGRTGLWLLDLRSDSVRQLAQLPSPVANFGRASWSSDGRVAFARMIPPDTAGGRWRLDLVALDIASGATHELPIQGLGDRIPRDPVWLGARLAFIAAGDDGTGPIWIADSAGGGAHAVSAETVRARTPSFSPDGGRVAWFAPDSAGRAQVWLQDISGERANGAPRPLTNHHDVTTTAIRWVADGSELIYSADGKLWKVPASGGSPTEIPFTASLTIARPRSNLPPVRFAEVGSTQPARGFTALAISPDAASIGVIALGKLWVIPVGGSPRSVAAVPLGASGLAWSPDGAQVAWSAGATYQEDLFATVIATGATRRVAAFPGRELFPAFSPDGRHLAFVHQGKSARLLVVPPGAENVDSAHARDLGAADPGGTSPPLWSPASDGLLLSPSARSRAIPRGTFVPLSGERRTISRFPEAPIFLQWTGQKILFVRHDRLWEAPFDSTGMTAEPRALGNSAALYASSARDGTLLFVSDSGLRIRQTNGSERSIGWPLSYALPLPEPVLIRNLRIIDGNGSPASAPQDVLIEKGRIARIAPAGTISSAASRVVDAEGRVAIPGLLDMHAHIYWPELVAGFVYFGVTTLRDQGASMAPLVAASDAIEAGVTEGPRLSYGGFQFYSDWGFDEDQGRGIEPEADSGHVGRSVALAQAFGSQHIKTRTFRRWDINARMIADAHRRGMRATGHCAHPLPLVAAGIDSKEHVGFCAARGDRYMYEDLVQLFKAAGVGVVPTISYIDFAVRVAERPGVLDEDAEAAPFYPAREAFDWMIQLGPRRAEWAIDVVRAREKTLKLWRAGVTLGAGTDIEVPTGVHMELAEMVAAGLPPLEAIKAATSGSARILGAEGELGTISVGKRADLVILDADPVADIRNTRKIWQVMKDGKVVDRAAILAKAGHPER